MKKDALELAEIDKQDAKDRKAVGLGVTGSSLEEVFDKDDDDKEDIEGTKRAGGTWITEEEIIFSVNIKFVIMLPIILVCVYLFL